MKKILPYIFLILSLLSGCSENSTEPTSDEIDHISGKYALEGTQINQRVCSPPYFQEYDCEPGEPLESDTVQTSLIIEIQVIEGRPDTVLFTGLEGADADIKYHRDADALPTPSMTECLTSGNPDYDCAYAEIHEERLTFNLSQFSAIYHGEGTVSEGFLRVETIYGYRGAVIKYSLEGEIIE